MYVYLSSTRQLKKVQNIVNIVQADKVRNMCGGTILIS